MYDNLGAQPGLPRPPLLPQPNPFGNAFAGAGSGLISGLGAYGEKILGSRSDYVQSNVLATKNTRPRRKKFAASFQNNDARLFDKAAIQKPMKTDGLGSEAANSWSGQPRMRC
ncbi:hypothetical protein Vadar_031365 [Vaccinium darrowii]|uniref:Uncharacterized protein n=1 Tax=Vaccinium darrowii TaxID=229202 RepID=A0ACB7Y4N0_9ERIC|nr:hypothetical protein Vadar_031365 [Vaccinium darrowii]